MCDLWNEKSHGKHTDLNLLCAQRLMETAEICYQLAPKPRGRSRMQSHQSNPADVETLKFNNCARGICICAQREREMNCRASQGVSNTPGQKHSQLSCLRIRYCRVSEWVSGTISILLAAGSCLIGVNRFIFALIGLLLFVFNCHSRIAFISSKRLLWYNMGS